MPCALRKFRMIFIAPRGFRVRKESQQAPPAHFGASRLGKECASASRPDKGIDIGYQIVG